MPNGHALRNHGRQVTHQMGRRHQPKAGKEYLATKLVKRALSYVTGSTPVKHSHKSNGPRSTAVGPQTKLTVYKKCYDKVMKQLIKRADIAPFRLIRNNDARITGTLSRQIATCYGGTNSVAGVFDMRWFSASDMRKCFNIANLTQSYQPTTPSRLFFKSLDATLQITNLDTTVCNLDLYDMVSRRDGFRGLSGAPNEFSPELLWDLGLTQSEASNQPVLGPGTQSFIGSKPFASQAFCQYFKVLRVHKLKLMPGAQATHKIHISPMRHITSDVLQMNEGVAEAGTNQIENVRNWTYLTMMVQYGSPESDSGAATRVPLSKTNLGCVIQKRYVFYPVAERRQVNYIDDYLEATAIGTAQTINPDTDAIVADTAA